MEMKKLVTFNSNREALMLSEALKSLGIHAEIHGNKEYSSLVLGTDLGNYDILVDSEKYDEAQNFLRTTRTGLATESLQDSSSYLKKSIVFAFLAIIMVPVIFNYVSLKNLFLYRKHVGNSAGKTLLTTVVVLLQLPAFIMLYILFSSITSITKPSCEQLKSLEPDNPNYQCPAK